MSIRAGAEAAAGCPLCGCVGFDRQGPPGAAGQRRGNAERSAGGRGAPEQQSRAHSESSAALLHLIVSDHDPAKTREPKDVPVVLI